MKKELIPYDGYEIHGCKDYGGFVEQVSDAEAEFWSLYGHIPGQGVECIGDFKTRQHAEEVRQRITGRNPVHPHCSAQPLQRGLSLRLSHSLKY